MVITKGEDHEKIAAVIGITALCSSVLTPAAFVGGPIVVEQEPVIAAQPVIAQGNDWSGAYVGAQLGYGDVDANLPAFEGYGGLGGLHIGYRWDWGTFIAGAELNHDTASIDLGAVAGNSIDSIARLKLIGGTEIGTDLLYGTIGAASAEATIAALDASDNGYFYGAGLAHPMWNRWIIGAEVLQHNFDNFDGTGFDLDTTTVTARVGFRF